MMEKAWKVSKLTIRYISILSKQINPKVLSSFGNKATLWYNNQVF
ncbi:MAG: hypothetical protein ACD_2C00209G0005 [uncultured bacterium (gcode 4)]|uniref:Uncharacterized protein n=1 Tax=uncultured bacterium (gcode 4) TaxID=1234023 RepID=K2FDM8_9BACT|nr:MAG: hypothetical protein ACD_2C00209G0005 [uncultured bacterium (gcode 4)]